MNNKDYKEINLKCVDSCSILNVIKYNDESFVSFLMYSGYKTSKLSIWKRLKVLFTGYVIDSDIVLSKKDIKKLKKFLYKVYKSESKPVRPGGRLHKEGSQIDTSPDWGI